MHALSIYRIRPTALSCERHEIEKSLDSVPLQYLYKTYNFNDVDIQIRSLLNKNQFSDDQDEAKNLGISSALWPIFGSIWESGEVLAHLMITKKIAGLRILEVGCGMALASHVLNHRLADITTTDYHPEVSRFLKFNVNLNSGNPIPFIRSDWANEDSELGKFDLIIGSDLLYERGHAKLLSEFINIHANKKAEVLIVNPKRGYQNQFSKGMRDFDFTHSQSSVLNTEAYLDAKYKGSAHYYLRE